MVDAIRNPVQFELTSGQRAETSQEEPPIVGFASDYAIADKKHDANAFNVW